jgi:predicted GH43/DUF377 family glycosyl hydrolase
VTVPPTVRDTGIVLRPDAARVIARLFVAGQELIGAGESRADVVLERLLTLDEHEVDAAVAALDAQFAGRHRDLPAMFAAHADLVTARIDPGVTISASRRHLLGATFTHEYTIEGAALCNPSAVLHPQQPDDGTTRFVMSARAVGEGHRSSVEFRTGTLHLDGSVTIDAPSPFAAAGVPRPGLPGVAERSYQVDFDPSFDVSERVLWPHAVAESHGMEDVRLVRFVDVDGTASYYGTYTAFDGSSIQQHVLHTTDFVSFDMSAMHGPAAAGKGLALFPRLVHGRYAALSRADRESNAVAFSHDMFEWPEASTLQVPTRAWELLQIGNCGSPIETDVGWLVLTHGVGPMRTYSIGAILLHLDDPRVVLAATAQPLVVPHPTRRDGYVPNVVYSCGGFAHGDTLVLPYGTADHCIAVATMSISEVLTSMDRR